MSSGQTFFYFLFFLAVLLVKPTASHITDSTLHLSYIFTSQVRFYLKINDRSLAWWHMPIIPLLGSRQKDHYEFEASCGYKIQG